MEEDELIKLQEHQIKQRLSEEKQPAPQPSFEPAETSIIAPVEDAPPPKQPTAPKPTFFERNPDLEKFIGENLVSKIGIGILVLAIAYFVKFAIDNNWIGEVGRVAIGLVCGGILVGLAHTMRNNYKAFSSVLVGGGIAVFYFTIALAYHQFHLFGQTTAFIIMLVITGFAVALSLLYDKQEVAIIALVGGFAAPFMVSDGSGNYKTLFIYLILLNAGLLVIAYNKAWRLLNALAFIFTVILVGGWLFSLKPDELSTTYRNGFIFCTVFYLLFFAINLAHNIRENRKFIASDFGILLANTTLYFAAGLLCLHYMHASEYKGLFSASMAVFNLAASYILFKNKKVDTNILYLLIGITLTFVSLSAPLQLEGNYITLFWASEAVLLYWLYQKSEISLMGLSSSIVWACMLISLVMDLFSVYYDSSKALAIIINKGFITTVYCAVACYCLFILVRKNPSRPFFKNGFTLRAMAFFTIAVILLFFAGGLEVDHQFQFYYPRTHFNSLYLQLYTFSFILLFVFIAGKSSLLQLSFYARAMLYICCIILYLSLIGEYYNIQQSVLLHNEYALHFTISHWLTVVLFAVVLYRLILDFRSTNAAESKHVNNFSWLICIVIITFLSIELNLLIRWLFYSKTETLENIQRVYIKTVLPILWGVCSFIFMWLGMKHSFRPLRIISLSLFLLTLLKLFIFDIRNITVAGKIAAFFCLGVLLLVVSFMYQRLKKIIIEDEQKPVP